jgi:hypothetical protein
MSEDKFAIASQMPRVIFARNVTPNVFLNFRLRAKAEGMSIDEAFLAIVTAYARGDFYVIDKHGAQKKELHNLYLDDHKPAGT